MAWRTHLFAALRNPHEPKILMLRSDRVWRLPHVLVPERAGFANGGKLVAAFERRLGTRPWLLRQIRFIDDEAAQRREVVYELDVLDRAWAAPAHGRWVGRSDLDRLPLADEPHRELLDRYLDSLERGAAPPERPPWARPGWLDDVRAWIEREAAQLGHTVTGIEQVKHWSISSVLRVTTDGPDLYFKVPARLPLFADEGALTARLAERFPDHVLAPLAVESEQGWILLPEFGELFDFWGAPLELRCEMLRRFAELQRRSASIADELLEDGCLDRRLDVLERQVGQLLDEPAAVAQLTPEEVAALREQKPALQEVCRRLAGLDLPATLVHGDLHVLNVARHDGKLVYFDWTDACIAHPFIDLISLQWEDEAGRAAMLSAYLEPWEGVESPERMLEAVGLAAVVIPLHHAVSYWQIVAALEPAAKPELDATHTFLREALEKLRGLLDA